MGRKESNQTNKTTTAINGIARSLKKLHQRETTGSSSDFRQLSPFSKWELLLKERILEEEFFSLLEEEFFPLWAVPFSMEITFTTSDDLPWILLFLLRTCVTGHVQK